ncbi:MAG: ABC transporter permease [Phycisphaerae bacterium]|nr:ABC transporter permease [Phycisphaerae bacterium]
MALPISYHWRNLFVRKTTTALTMGVVAAVVGVFAWMLGFSAALDDSLSVASDDRKLIVLKPGATAESNSAIPIEDYNRLNQLTELARTDAGSLQSPEMLVQISLPRLRDGGRTAANVAVRGVTETAFRVHTTVKIVAGRTFNPAAREVIVGRAAAAQFAGLQIGSTLNLGYSGDRGYQIVGHFSADGGPLESEIWGYLPSLLNAYNRTMYSSANLRLRDGADPKAVIGEIEGPAIQLSAQTEPAYWQEQSRNIRTYLGIANFLVAIMCIAAVFSIANTMFASVAGRTREIAMLRTIGFSGGQILTGFVIESVLLSLIGGLIGCAGTLAYLQLAGSTKDMFGSTTFTTLAFDIRLSPLIVAKALGLVTLVGIIGAAVPARRAARVQVVNALRAE